MDDIVEHSRQLIERGSKSFAGAARLFDPATRDGAYMLYAWCRHCDDVIDDQVLGFGKAPRETTAAEKRVALADLDFKTREALAGRATEPVFKALARVVQQHAIPARHPLELLQGFRMDVDGRRYHSIEETLEYCYHVAGVVGVMMATIMGARERDVLLRASDLGIAFQLTNIARDLVPDLESGRIYVPAAWLSEAGLEAATLADETVRPRLFALAERLLDTADAYYASAGYGLAHLPLRSSWAVAAARTVYRDIGSVVRARGAAAWDQRASVSRSRKLASLASGLVAAAGARTLGRARPAPPRANLWTPPAFDTL